jgi:hypothetical protein
MLPKSLPEKFLKYMYRRHISSYGYGIRNIEKDKWPVTTGPGIEQKIPEILVEQNGVVFGKPCRIKKYLVVDSAKELEAKGYVQFSNDGGEFWLTEAEYRIAEQNWFRRFVGYLNKNRVILTLIAIICSILALLIKFK